MENYLDLSFESRVEFSFEANLDLSFTTLKGLGTLGKYECFSNFLTKILNRAICSQYVTISLPTLLILHFNQLVKATKSFQLSELKSSFTTSKTIQAMDRHLVIKRLLLQQAVPNSCF